MRLRSALVVSALLASAVLVASDAPAPAKASGTFEDEKWKVKIGGAYAFWDKSAGTDDAPVIQVAVSNSGFNEAAFEGVFDRQHAINTLFADEKTKVVYFEFDENGKYRGLSYYFESGDGCGYCFDSKVKSTVRATGGRLQGELSYEGGDRQFQIQLDVPIPPKKWGEPLPRDGGEPGKAFLAYHSALDKRDKKALFEIVDADYKGQLKKYEGKGKLADYLDYRWHDEHTEMKTIRITGGYVRGDRAVVLFDGSNAYIDHLYGEAWLQREGGRWLVDGDMVEVGTRP
jgi:hypothetical protein